MISGSRIESIGSKLPAKKISTQSIVDRMHVSPPIKLELISGIKERRFCTAEEDSVSLAFDATNDCLSYSSYDGKDIEMIIYCSISKFSSDYKNYFEPSISGIVKEKIGANSAINFDISNACAGMSTGIHIGNDFIERGVVKNCLVISGEYISTISKNAIQNINSTLSKEIASLTVGDSGAALILEKASEEDSFEVLKLQTFGQYSELCIGKISEKYVGAQMFTQMQKLHKVSISESPKFVEESLLEAGLKYGDIDYLIPHQTAKRAIQSGSIQFHKYFGSSPKEIINNLDTNGNTATTTHVLALYQLLKKKKFKKEDRIMLLTFASGLVMGVVVFKLKNLIEKYG